MATTAALEHVALAQALPPRLLHFFKRFPPPQLTTPTSTTTTETSSPRWKTNPFLASKNPTTGAWHSPHYSLRRQADLFRLAIDHNVLSLMPTSPKHPLVKEAKRIQHGLRVKGTGEGQRVKGKYWERTLQSRLDTRRQAMERTGTWERVEEVS
ncbi:54S ribosomal protein L25, mitochondrial [Recurvomyces mirabilis]|uniref:54S ribosomal protein L25, mitochondrial n=1 Tax=Recurvomyces mirabilis TaxID=574656 RepID=A0AAE0WTN9_9PEZI|nr:54S ribosomal protein L25, mitochondrial [Recurvomyces mirabilis]KAK5157496.1 54S ribosomal protein L25, mitochondrial [Recurvomyces mirabilis]